MSHEKLVKNAALFVVVSIVRDGRLPFRSLGLFPLYVAERGSAYLQASRWGGVRGMYRGVKPIPRQQNKHGLLYLFFT